MLLRLADSAASPVAGEPGTSLARVVSKEERARRKQLADDYLRAEQAASIALLPLDRGQLESLLEHVDASVLAEGCDHARRATDAWAATWGVDLERLHVGLEEYGGYCDCEVVLNVHPEEVLEPVRMPHRCQQ